LPNYFYPTQTLEEALPMKNAARIVVSTLASLTLATAIWARPPATTDTQSDPTAQQDPAQQQSVSGKIASVAADSFTLTVTSSQTSAPGQQFRQQASKAKTMTFHIDNNTTVEGKLKVDANADVTYREDHGSNVAISVRVTS
jgi:hypothetical protein